MLLDLSIQKNTAVSIHDQLVKQLSVQIAAGQLQAGTKLPSVRKLSRMLNIHYNTCLAAYRELEQLGFLHIRQGSGVVVANVAETRPEGLVGFSGNPALEQLAKTFVQQVHQSGFQWAEVLRAVKAANRQLLAAGARPVVFVNNIHSDILPLFQAELSHCLKRPVKGILLEDLEPDTLPEETLYITSRYHIGPLREHLKHCDALQRDNVMVIDVGRVQQALEVIKQLPEGDLVVVVSQSSTVLNQAEAVITALRGDALLLRMVHRDEGEEEVRRALKYAKIVFADFLAAPWVGEMTRKPVQRIRVVPDEEVAKLSEALKRVVSA